MQKFSKKSGLTLIEILCALNIITIFSLFFISLQLNNIRLKRYNSDKMLYLQVMQHVKEELYNNLTYEEIRTLKTENKKYVDYEKLSLDIIKNNDIKVLFSSSLTHTNKTYLIIEIDVGTALRIDEILHFKYSNKEDIITSTFFKGNY